MFDRQCLIDVNVSITATERQRPKFSALSNNDVVGFICILHIKNLENACVWHLWRLPILIFPTNSSGQPHRMELYKLLMQEILYNDPDGNLSKPMQYPF